jgi:geranylgeranyl reductase family protein
MDETFETIIIGAGPAGCAAAFDLAAAGRQVLLLDKCHFPRLKPCAGALTPKTIQSLRFDVSPIVRRVCSQMTLSLGKRSRTFAATRPIAFLTVRQEFDRFCLDQTIARGVLFKPQHRLLALSRIAAPPDGARSWLITTTRGRFTAKYLIGADGANSIVRRLLLRHDPLQTGLALETCIPRTNVDGASLEFDFAAVDRGYGWVFPKDDHLNVGLYTLNPTIPHAAARLADFVAQKTGRSISGKIHGHKIPHDGRRLRQAGRWACLIGDAAGMIDPFLGEGIYHAIRSGQLAAQAILRAAGSLAPGLSAPGAPPDFATAMTEITTDLQSYDAETRRFYANIHRGYRRLTATPLAPALIKGFTLGWTVRQIKRGLWKLPFIPA